MRTMSRHHSRSSSMQSVQMMAVFISATLFCLVAGTHHPLHCSKWHSNCHKYDQYCAGAEKRPWKSCCEPLQYEYSGDSSEDANGTSALPSNIYTIKTSAYSSASAWCDMTTDGGGWMVILRRADGKESFARYYNEYEEGFGTLDHDFFYGLRALYDLTSRGNYEARIDFYDKRNHTESSAYGVYHSITIGNKEGGYKLHLGNFTRSEENLEDNLKQFIGQPFVARKRGQVIHESSCLDIPKSGGWWYTADFCRGLNGKGSVLTEPYNQVSWFDPQNNYGKRYYEKYELKIRLSKCLESDSLSNS